MSTDPKLSSIATKFDDYLLTMLKKGGSIVRDLDGAIIKDAKGNPEREFTNQFLSVVERRLQHCGINGNKLANPATDIGATMARLRKGGKLKGLTLTGGDLPPLSDERDAATG